MKLLNKNGYCNYAGFMDKDIDMYIVLGHRSDGKTYGAIRIAMQEFFDSGTPSAYVRRSAEMLTGKEVSYLITPHYDLIEKYSDYDSAQYRSRAFRFYNSEEKKSHNVPFLYTMPLSTWETSKGQDRGVLKYIIFDEMISNTGYLQDECFKWENVLSSLMRDRDGTKVFMLCNPLNTECPYFEWYGIDIDKLTQGTVTDFNYDSGAKMRFVWLPESNRQDKPINKILQIGAKKSIVSGAWEIKQYPHLQTGIYKDSEKLVTWAFSLHDRVIKCEILSHKEMGLYLFFYPADSTAGCIRVYTDDKNIVPSNIVAYAIVRDNLQMEIDRLVREKRMFYATNRTGDIVDAWLSGFYRGR